MQQTYRAIKLFGKVNQVRTYRSGEVGNYRVKNLRNVKKKVDK